MSLSLPEARCLELAWDALGNDTVPVGAVVTGADGVTLFEGRSRMYETSAPPGQIANSLLAHAEVNALLGLAPSTRHESLTVTSSLEPCALCLGAIGMATIGRLVYMGADPYGGAVGRLEPPPHLARLPLLVEGPRDDLYGLLASALHVAFYLRRNPEGHVVAVHRTAAPGLFRAGEALAQADVAAMAKSQSLENALPSLLSAVDDAS